MALADLRARRYSDLPEEPIGAGHADRAVRSTEHRPRGSGARCSVRLVIVVGIVGAVVEQEEHEIAEATEPFVEVAR